MDYFLRFLAFAALTCSFKPLPALNAGDLEAAIVIVLPFCGLRNFESTEADNLYFATSC